MRMPTASMSPAGTNTKVMTSGKTRRSFNGASVRAYLSGRAGDLPPAHSAAPSAGHVPTRQPTRPLAPRAAEAVLEMRRADPEGSARVVTARSPGDGVPSPRLGLLHVHVLDGRDLALAVAHQAGLGRPHDGGERLVHLAAELGDVALRQVRVVARDARRRDRRGDEGREARRGERRIPPRAARGREREPGAVVGDVVHRDVRGEREGGRARRVELARRVDAREQRLERGGVRAVVERRVTGRRLIEVAGRAPPQDARERDLRERVRRGDRVPVNGTSRFAPPWMAWMKSLAFADQPLLVRFGVWQNAQVGASFRCPAWNVGIEPSWSWQALHFAFDTIVRRAVWFFAVFQTFGAATTRPPSFFWRTRGVGELQSTVTPPVPIFGPHVTAVPVPL